MGQVKEFHAAALGVHKAGLAYVPIDLEYPEERVQFMLEDSGASIILTEENVAEMLKTPAASVALSPLCSPDKPAYMIYTSGSTGTPKGVVIPHRALTLHLTLPDKLRINKSIIHR